MQKYHIGVFNMRELLQQHEYKHLSFFRTQLVDKLIKRNRYSANTKFTSVLDQWNNRYSIETKDMLLLYCQQQRMNHRSQPDGLPALSRSSIVDLSSDISAGDSFAYNHSHNQYLLFDKSHMTIVYDARNAYNEEERKKESKQPLTHWSCPACTFHNSLQVTICEICGTNNPKSKQTEESTAFKEQKVVLLSYFDLKRQTIQFVRFVIVHKLYNMQDIIKYIETNSVALLHDYLEAQGSHER
eukprot:325283_1